MRDFVISPCQKYVQDALREQLSERVYQCLREEGGHIYVCGDVTMAGDVLKNVQQIIKQEGNMSLEDAGLFISRLRVRQMGSGSVVRRRGCGANTRARSSFTRVNPRQENLPSSISSE